MKQILILLCFFTFLASSCEDVVDIPLNTAEPKLVIQANVFLLEDSTSLATVKLTTTAPFFNNQVPIVTNATVLITDDNGTIFPFTYTSDGIYEGALAPEFDTNYTLEVNYEGETYTASEQLVASSSLEYVEQNNNGGFTGEDIELKVFFDDEGGVRNYYFFEGLSSRGNIFDVYDDEFFDGNQIFGFYFVEDTAPGDEILFNLYGVDEQFYNFMLVLLQQSTDQSDGPFETQPATVRGNIINETNFDNFPLGYFRISEVSTLSYTVQ